jgi:peroxiredoxin
VGEPPVVVWSYHPDMRADVSEIRLTDPDGGATTLGDVAADPLVVILMRYFGCLPCQEYISEAERVLDDMPDGTGIVGIAGSAAYQARWLRDTKEVKLPLLLDPDEQVRAVAELGNLSTASWATPQGWRNYLGSMQRGFRPQIPTSDALKAPGIVVFDKEFVALWVHRGETLGDYPPIDDLVLKIHELADAES